MSIVGVDEVDLNRNQISWMSPLARAMMKSGPGDRVVLHAPGGTEQLQILEVRYQRILVEPFSEPPGAEAAPRSRPRTDARYAVALQNSHPPKKTYFLVRTARSKLRSRESSQEDSRE